MWHNKKELKNFIMVSARKPTKERIRMMEIRKYFCFDGRVQGVGFRWKAMEFANMLGLTGWVYNAYDGTVEMEVQGEDVDIDMLIQRLNTDSFIRITKMDTRQITTVQGETEFRVKG